MSDVHVFTSEPLFTTLSFWVLFALFYAGFFAVRKLIKARNLYLLLVSYVLYILWDGRFLIVILLSTIIGFSIGLALQHASRHRRLILWSGISLQLVILAYCKYAGFFADSLKILLERMGYSMPWTLSHVVLPQIRGNSNGE